MYIPFHGPGKRWGSGKYFYNHYNGICIKVNIRGGQTQVKGMLA